MILAQDARGAEMSATDFLKTVLKTFQPAQAATRLWRDLARDWRRWTAVERILAAGLLAALLGTPVASLAAIIHSAA
jgi:hypothetical protein